jgi:hypothetical protein
MILRQILINSFFNKSTNDSLDGMRVMQLNQECYMVEDLEGQETLIGFKTKKALKDAANIN